MNLYRITRKEYKDDMNGTGSFLYGGRWNFPETYMLYTTRNVAMAAFEVFVNYGAALKGYQFSLLTLQINATAMIHLELNKLTPDWSTNTTYTRKIGNDFLENGETPFMEVPSSIIPIEKNVLINPVFLSPKNLIAVEDFIFDKRIIDSFAK